MEVKQFSEIELSSDGNAVIATIEWSDSSPTKCTIPYRHAVWLAKAILSVAHQAVERQVASGAIEPFTVAQEALLAETVQVLVKPNQESAAIDSVGRWTSNKLHGPAFARPHPNTTNVQATMRTCFADICATPLFGLQSPPAYAA